jgi:hypothetical protein
VISLAGVRSPMLSNKRHRAAVDEVGCESSCAAMPKAKTHAAAKHRCTHESIAPELDASLEKCRIRNPFFLEAIQEDSPRWSPCNGAAPRQ